MNEENMKFVSKLMLDVDERPFAAGEKELYKMMIDDSRSPEQVALAFAIARSHPFSTR